MTATERVPVPRLIAAGVQTFLYGWLTVCALAVLTFTLKADSPALGEATWQDAARIATGWWMTAFGGTLHFGGVQITLPPLLLTLVTFVGALGFIRRLPLMDWRDLAIISGSGAITVGLLGSLAPDGSNAWRGMLGAFFLLLIACVTSRNRTDWFGQGFFTTPAGRALYDGLMLALRVTGIILLLAIIAALAGLALGWSQISTISGFYIIDILARILLWAFQLCYLPTLLMWAVAYLLGAGFAIGAGTSFSVLGVTSAPLPAVPLFGAMPQPHVSLPWLLPLIVAIVFAYGWRKASAFPTLNEAGATGGIQVVIVFFLFALLGGLSSGSIGPERMQDLGPEPPRLALAAALLLGVPLLAGLLAGNRVTRERIGSAYTAWKAGRAQASEEKTSTDYWDDSSTDEAAADEIPTGDRSGAKDNEEPARADGQSGPVGRLKARLAALCTRRGERPEGAEEARQDPDAEESLGGALPGGTGGVEEPWDDEDEGGILLEDDTEIAYQRVESAAEAWDREMPSAKTAPMSEDEE